MTFRAIGLLLALSFFYTPAVESRGARSHKTKTAVKVKKTPTKSKLIPPQKAAPTKNRALTAEELARGITQRFHISIIGQFVDFTKKLLPAITRQCGQQYTPEVCALFAETFKTIIAGMNLGMNLLAETCKKPETIQKIVANHEIEYLKHCTVILDGAIQQINEIVATENVTKETFEHMRAIFDGLQRHPDLQPLWQTLQNLN